MAEDPQKKRKVGRPNSKDAAASAPGQQKISFANAKPRSVPMDCSEAEAEPEQPCHSALET